MGLAFCVDFNKRQNKVMIKDKFIQSAAKEMKSIVVDIGKDKLSNIVKFVGDRWKASDTSALAEEIKTNFGVSDILKINAILDWMKEKSMYDPEIPVQKNKKLDQADITVKSMFDVDYIDVIETKL